MRVISFYSYKGGTGRTLLVANMAILASRLGLRVVAADLDLEAPGLSYKLLTDPPLSEGILGWINAYKSNQPIAVNQISIPVKLENEFIPGGSLHVIPAGPPPSFEYLQKMRNLQSDSTLDEHTAIDTLLAFRDEIERQINPDILLIDARTGITTTNAITNRVLADDVVALTLNTREQLEGTRAVLRSLKSLSKPGSDEPLALHVIISRIKGRFANVGSYRLTNEELEISESISTFFHEPSNPLSSTLSKLDISLLHNDPTVADSEFLTMSRQDALDSTALHVDYIRIAEKLFGGVFQNLSTGAIQNSRTHVQKQQVARFFARQNDIVDLRSRKHTTEKSADEDAPNLVEEIAQLRQLTITNRTYLPDLAKRLLELERILVKTGAYTESITTLVEAIDVYQDLSNERPGRYDRQLASASQRLSTNYWRTGDLDRAHAAISRSIESYRSLTNRKPERYAPDLAHSLHLAGILPSYPTSESADLIRESIEIYEREIDRNPSKYLPRKARALSDLGSVLGRMGNTEMAREHMIEAVEIYRQLRETSPKYFRESQALALSRLGLLLLSSQEASTVSVTLKESIHIYRQLAAENPARYNPHLAASLLTHGIGMWSTAKYTAALASIEEAVEIYRAISKIDPDKFNSELANALGSLSVTQSRLELRNEACESSIEALALYREQNSSSDDFASNVADALSSLCIRLWPLKRYDEALETIKESVAIYRKLSKEDPHFDRDFLADSIDTLGHTLALLDRDTEALEASQESTLIYQQLADADPERFSPDLASSLETLSVRFDIEGNNVDALKSIKAAVNLRRQLASSVTNDANDRRAELKYALEQYIRIAEAADPNFDIRDIRQEIENIREN
ncbi:KGGVGR-motif variant AAA ATPase [Rhodococcus erythropolis]|uniref:KGGVGR-motif variant AAA ATPase n=1 Tax=Rhodococcus erythropolis TaxID=1833 RepID=UPI0036DC1C80